MPSIAATTSKTHCYHCGDVCSTTPVTLNDKSFCCEGCKMVFQIINQNELCEYYNLNENPGLSQRNKWRKDKFAFLDDIAIESKLISFRDDRQVYVTFYLPQIHCSSCLYLLENLHKFEPGILSANVNFTRKEIDIIYLSDETDLRKVVELLARIGYEPYISLNDLKQKRPVTDKRMIYQLGIAGFCFGNIMLMSFPEYLGIDASEAALRAVFRWMNFGLAIPVFLFSALPFYESSWKSLKHRFLNIDAPIALAIIITFTRSVVEVISGTGGGYFDSMTGIVFFMLAGRILQDKTYRQLSFDRDYTSYFPIAVSVLKQGKQVAVTLPEIRPGDELLIHNEELIPADGILTRGKAFIDYSFVTGESMPVWKETGELVYAGGKQTGGNIQILVVKEVAQSYLTSLWGREEIKNTPGDKQTSFVHLLSRWFTFIVFAIALATAIYWRMNDPSRIWASVTAIFIIACPCALLLSNTFTNGNVLRILSRNKFYLRSASTIEAIARTTHIVFDKTGTLTSSIQQELVYEGKSLTPLQKKQIASLSACSSHPLSRALTKLFQREGNLPVSGYKELAGEGIEGIVQGDLIKIGSAQFISGHKIAQGGSAVFLGFENGLHGWFRFNNHYRSALPSLIDNLKANYKLSVLSGDNEAEEKNLQRLFGDKATLLFNQSPQDKLDYIKLLRQRGEKVMMIGDGLNDAGALKQSDIGIALSEQNNNFTPSSDAILDAGNLSSFTKFIRLCKANQKIILASFVLSIVYNIVGLYFAVSGTLSPLIAAILMPSSSLCIFLITFGSSNWLAKRLKL